ncbi:M23 family metallopeptidase [Capnocytophaga catalasegens]|nr:M23 family metallopeptidase [Capnocytophaga catalasegens]
MPKTKYYYDSETLSFRKIKNQRSKKIRNVFLFLLASLLFSFLIVIVVYNMDFMYTPRELQQKREIKEYQTQYAILNKKMEQMEEVLHHIADRDNNLYRAYFEAAPIPAEQRESGFGGVNRYEYLERFSNSKLLITTTKRIESLLKQLAVQSKSLDEIAVLAKEREKLLAAIPAIQPVQNKDLKRMASGYGWRNDPFTKVRKFHYGMDFTAPSGTPIYASGDGVVTRADNNSAGYGEHIRIDHGFGYESLYAHLSQYSVRPGQKVKRGDLIGFVGSSGRSEAPHLHYEIRKDGQHLNPINFYYGSLSAAEYAELLRQSTQENQSLD